MKLHQRIPLLSELESALERDEQILMEHWMSSECQDKFKKYLVSGQW